MSRGRTRLTDLLTHTSCLASYIRIQIFKIRRKNEKNPHVTHHVHLDLYLPLLHPTPRLPSFLYRPRARVRGLAAL